MPTLRSLARPVALGLIVLMVTTLVSYALAKKTNSTGPVRPDQAQLSSMFPSGEHIVAYLFTSSECGFCTERLAKAAIANLKDSLLKTNRGRYAAISVVAVVIDDNIDSAISYVRGIRQRSPGAFDQIIAGGSWLNETMAALAWRDRIATTDVPQVLIFKRSVNATTYPHEIGISKDSVIVHFSGRDSLLAFVKNGAPVPWKAR